ncbi:MAG: hypothetical protein WCD26_10350, partial [Pseudolabrys sp.]
PGAARFRFQPLPHLASRRLAWRRRLPTWFPGTVDITADSPEKARNAGNAQKFHAFAGVEVIS